MVAYGRSPVSPPNVPSTNDTIADFGQTTTDGTLPQKRKKVLLLTNAERGQANVFLAVADALLHQTDQNPVVHFASFAPIEPAVHAITEQLAQRTCPPGGARILFHRLGGLSMKAAWDRPEVVGGNGHAGLKGWQLLLRVTLPWTGPEFLEVFDSVVNVIEEVQPDAVAVDPCLAPALTACHHLGVKFVVLSPNTIKDFAMPSQPNLAPLWKYPCVGSGIPYPVPLLLVPFNFVFVFYSFIMGTNSAHENELSRYLKQIKGPEMELLSLSKLATTKTSGIKILVANLPELEYPFSVIPEYIIPCGPMLNPAKPLQEADPSLFQWLERGPTVYINLGTHRVTSEDAAVEMAMAIKMAMDEVRSWSGHTLSDMQVLWKLVPDTSNGEYDARSPKSRIHNVLGRYIDMDITRIVQWVEAEPSVILEHKNVVLSVHHGGANSFLETVSAGKPHVVLPCWMDTFDFANRAELAGIGLWGNRRSAPSWKADELGPILRKAIIGLKASSLQQRAQAMAQRCRNQGGGRFKAARVILHETETSL